MEEPKQGPEGGAARGLHTRSRYTQREGDPLRGLSLPGLHRSTARRVVSGVAGGLGESLEVDPTFIRFGFVLLALCGGTGILAYGVLWAALPQADSPAPISARPRRSVAIALILGGTMILLRAVGLWFGSTIAVSVGLGALGCGIVWLRGDERERARWVDLARRAPGSAVEAVTQGGVPKTRLALGAVLVAGGIVVFLTGTNALQVHPAVVLAVLATAAGAGMIAGPWGWRLVTALGTERRERIRSEERAEMAAHLHDSVLQTLAMIQRSDKPREMIALARNQERELRAWLSGRGSPSAGGPATMAAALERMAAAIELQCKVAVEVVTVGDAPIDDHLQGLLDACREATLNAAKHSGAAQISIYAEANALGVTAYVRDQGAGFDPAGVAADRRGIAESIRGRMQRSGGHATIESSPGSGTEVQLTLPATSNHSPTRAVPPQTAAPPQPASGSSAPAQPGDSSAQAQPGGSSAPAQPGGSSAPAQPGGSSAPAQPGGSSAPAQPGGSSAPAQPGGSSAPAQPGGSSAPAQPGGSSAPAQPGGSSAPAQPGGSSAPAQPGGSSAPAQPGGSPAPACPAPTPAQAGGSPAPAQPGGSPAPACPAPTPAQAGGSSAPAQPGGSSVPAQPGGSSAPARPAPTPAQDLGSPLALHRLAQAPETASPLRALDVLAPHPPAPVGAGGSGGSGAVR